MGQTQSDAAAEAGSNTEQSPPSIEPPPSPVASSMEALVAEAMATGDNDSEESLEEKAQRALNCPCVADLRKGPCGVQFSEAFVCFIKSTAEEKGSDCVNPFVALQNCIKANPDAFTKDILDEEKEPEEEKVQDYKIIPPSWSREPRPKN
ncbi:mitochondrial intermembrane space import and assembly protein 40-like [Musa troglodytarum]|uniref:Mitochondrial intermembrane space import and assembly protein 40 homolog n=1 Tax=Musa troglodytarum TaxID=320322 RepID=A0A9E7FSG9_9LILI|nr:mitochondrial intermembrane space import and assembly protein 40-like [Musa troglodytarum]